MPTFKDAKSLEKYLMNGLRRTVENGKDKAYNVIKYSLSKYYGEYTPEFFERTRQVLNSLVKGDVVQTGNGYKSEVYVDLGSLNHPNYYTYIDDGKTYRMRRNWSEEKILDSVMTWGSHGGKDSISGTAVWTESMQTLDSDLIDFLKRELIANGIPVK